MAKNAKEAVSATANGSEAGKSKNERFVSVYSGGETNAERMLDGVSFGGVELSGRKIENNELVCSYRGNVRFVVSAEGLLTVLYGEGYPNAGKVFMTVELPLPPVVAQKGA